LIAYFLLNIFAKIIKSKTAYLIYSYKGRDRFLMSQFLLFFFVLLATVLFFFISVNKDYRKHLLICV